ncbi:hypothetical protein CPC735_012680 [Coccidioides posadasii C735 delta SOWgp]|uniref:UBA domain-containing protein n=1 Tax=Coccidioides posadasii (strain C735) TaxID=222929 RepID=C5NZQ7_COCP7|nr:hypothetical protein CPC735_012680 [Coccidioides posadasii C735 delta SOWgp]EER29950.1 hypothetical protein CPC735_012680 [Coccidioides posadasii C735 delta SOWgp]|eukprot:XP_003072095.1 hypothetical protein CPC735_012680 [Coccidioides posadasii C735 delta SOWgp]
MLHPGCQQEGKFTKKQQLPLPAAWSRNSRPQSPQVPSRKSTKSVHGDLKGTKKHLTGMQKVEIVKSIWQVNMPLLHSNGPVDTAMEYFNKIDCPRMAGARFEPRQTNSRFSHRGAHTKSLYGERTKPGRPRIHRNMTTVKSGLFREQLSTVRGSHVPLAHYTHVPAAPEHPAQFPERTLAKIKTSGLHHPKIKTESTSPAPKEQMWSYSLERNVPSPLARHASALPPLAASQSQSYYFIPAKIGQSSVYDRSPYQNSPALGSGASTSGFSAGLTPNINGFISSRTSIEDSPDVISPTNTSDGVSPTQGYDLISPISAGVFDDCPRLKRTPTFIKQRSIRESQMKPLPPAPGMPVAPLVIRRGTLVKPLDMPRPQSRVDEPVFLPQNPKPSDLDSLDEAFRRSGLLEDEHSRARSPSLQEATEQLEKQLSRMSSAASLIKDLPDFGQEASQDRDSSTSTREEAMSLVQDAHAKTLHTTKSHLDALSRFSSVKKSSSYIGAKDFALRRSITLSAHNLCEAQNNVQQLKHHHSCDNISKISLPTSSHSRSISLESSPPVSCGPFRTLSRREPSIEHPARLRLPRMRATEHPSEAARELVNLSVVVESPCESDNRTDSMDDQASSSTAEDRSPGPSSSDAEESHQRPPTPEGQPLVEQSPPEQLALFPKLLEIYTASCAPSRASRVPEQPINNISAVAAEKIVLRILQSVGTLEELFNLAVLNRAFYSIFKKNELLLIKGTLFRMSPAAWELREMSPPWEDDDYDVGIVDRPVPEYTPDLYIRHYMRDLCTMVSLKWLILVRCESLLRPETIRALAGQDEERSAEVDDAFWRVWTFCRLFGCGKGREEDIVAQADWLSGGSRARSHNRNSSTLLTCPLAVDSVLFDPPSGFAGGNQGGLTATQLYDMMEIWTCLGVLVQGFYGKNDEAREYGVFDSLGVKAGDRAEEDALLESWTQYLLTLGPSAILTLSSLNPDTPIETMFARAQSLGWTKWTSPTKANSGSNRSFLKEAVSRVYDNRLVRGKEVPRFQTPNLQQSQSPQIARPSSPGRRPRSYSAGASIPKQRRREFARELRRRRQEMKEQAQSKLLAQDTEERPISKFQEVIQRLNGSPSNPTSSDSRSKILQPTSAPSNRNHTATPTTPAIHIAPRGPSPEAEEKISQGRHPSPAPYQRRSRTPVPTFIDPADKALHKLVYELGFNESDAKWALKCTDTGLSLDVEAAIELLLPKSGIGSDTVGGCGRGCTLNGHSPPSCPKFHVKKSRTTAGTGLLHRPTWRWA